MPVITHSRKQEATRSSHSSKESLKILSWVEWHLVTIKAVHWAGSPEMAKADWQPVPPWAVAHLSRLPGSSQECQEPCLALVGPSPPPPRLPLHQSHKTRRLLHRTFFLWRLARLLHLFPQLKLTRSTSEEPPDGTTHRFECVPQVVWVPAQIRC